MWSSGHEGTHELSEVLAGGLSRDRDTRGAFFGAQADRERRHSGEREEEMVERRRGKSILTSLESLRLARPTNLPTSIWEALSPSSAPFSVSHGSPSRQGLPNDS